MDTIAICLVIVDELHHEEIWKWWLGDGIGTKEEEDRSLNDSSSNMQENELPARSSCSCLPPATAPQSADPSQSVANESVNKRRFNARLFIHAKYTDRIKSPWVRARTLGTVCYVMLCYVMLCYVMLCYVMLRYVMLCHVMLCYVMLCYVTNHIIEFSNYAIIIQLNNQSNGIINDGHI